MPTVVPEVAYPRVEILEALTVPAVIAAVSADLELYSVTIGAPLCVKAAALRSRVPPSFDPVPPEAIIRASRSVTEAPL